MIDPHLSTRVFPAFRGTLEDPDPSKLILPLASLTRDPDNARLHPERNLRQIRASIRRRGQQTPIVVTPQGLILKGNGTHEAAELEEWSHVWVVVSSLAGAEATAYAISDNATGLSSTWNFEQLAANVTALDEFDNSEMEFASEDLGFEEHELVPLRAAEWQPPAPVDSADVHATPATAADDKPAADPHIDLEEGDKASDECAIACTPNQREVVDRAIERVRLICGEVMTEGRCIELICADYIADPNNDLPRDRQIHED